MLVEVIPWSDGEHHESVAESILVASLTVLKNAERVGNAPVICRHESLQVVVFLCEIGTPVAIDVESVWREEG